MRLRYELNADFRDGSAGARVKIKSDSLTRARKHAVLQLRAAYGPGFIYGDGWRFTHIAGPNDPAKRRWTVRWPRADRRMAGPVDAAISVYFVADSGSAPPFALSGQTPRPLLRDRPSVMLYRPRLGFAEVELLLLRAGDAGRRRLAWAIYVLLLIVLTLAVWTAEGGAP